MGVVKLSEYRPGTNRVVCQNPVSESEVCGFAWELAVPTTGKVNYQIACLRCGHAYEVIVKAPKPTRRRNPGNPSRRRSAITTADGATSTRTAGIGAPPAVRFSGTRGRPMAQPKRQGRIL